MTFPHGTPQGYWKGCHEKCCLDAEHVDPRGVLPGEGRMSENEANRVALAVKALVEEVGRRVGALPGGPVGLDRVSAYCPPELRYRRCAEGAN